MWAATARTPSSIMLLLSLPFNLYAPFIYIYIFYFIIYHHVLYFDTLTFNLNHHYFGHCLNLFSVLKTVCTPLAVLSLFL